MSQETSKQYLAAAKSAQEASNAALPQLAAATANLEAAKNARAVLQKSLAEAKTPQEKAELTQALKNFNDTVYNPAVVAQKVASDNVNNPRADAARLREQAATAADAPENSTNLAPLGNLASGDSTSYSGGDSYYPGEGASGPQAVQTAQPAAQPQNATAGLEPTPLPAGYVPAQTYAVNPTGSPQQLNPATQGGTAGSTAEPTTFKLISQPDAVAVPTFTNTPVAVVSPEAVAENDNLERLALQTFQGQYQKNPTPISDAERQAFLLANEADAGSINTAAGVDIARSTANATAYSMSNTKDLRFRISLAPSAKYLYNIATQKDILYPLAATDGVIFPYTPTVSMTYSAAYEPADVVHSNYKMYHYKNSSIDSISIIADFTAQDTIEANYLLAVIHFFRSVTKMFYGQDQNPPRGTPPPLCYLSGYGTYSFDRHPIAITSFALSYPNDVNYINAGASLINGQQLADFKKPTFPEKRSFLTRIARLKSTGLAPGGITSKNPFESVTDFTGITRVPTKLSITLGAIPIVTRNNVSNYFSLRDYATGALLKNSNNYGGTW